MGHEIELQRDERLAASRKVMYYYSRLLAAPGTLHLTSKRLVFQPQGSLDQLAGAKQLALSLKRVRAIAYKGALRPRLVVETDTGEHHFLDQRAAPDFLAKAQAAVQEARGGSEASGERRAGASAPAEPTGGLTPHAGEVLIVGNTDFYGIPLDRIVAELDVKARAPLGLDGAEDLLEARLDEWSLVVVNLLEDAEERLAFVDRVRATRRGDQIAVWVVEPLFDKPDPGPLWERGVSGFLDKAMKPNQVSDLLNEFLRGDSTPADRRHLATSVHFPVEGRAGEGTEQRLVTAYARSVGQTALFLETASAMRLGTDVALRFRVPGSDRVVEARAEVVYMRPRRGNGANEAPAGIGVKFREIADEDRELLAGYLKAKAYKVNENAVIFGL